MNYKAVIRAIEKRRDAVEKERDKINQMIDDLEALRDTCDEALHNLQLAVDALSQQA
jgi:prefoldin subunit 5